MNKSILISVNSKEAMNILNENANLLLRKRVPKNFIGWVYIYVTKAKPFIIVEKFTDEKTAFIYNGSKLMEKYQNIANGKVVARFWFDEYETFDGTKGNPKIYVKACVDDKFAYNYLKGKTGYAWHIKKLEIFDKPLELSDFYNQNPEP